MLCYPILEEQGVEQDFKNCKRATYPLPHSLQTTDNVLLGQGCSTPQETVTNGYGATME
jgi:hypothetical protein